MPNEDEIVDRAGIGNDQTHSLESNARRKDRRQPRSDGVRYRRGFLRSGSWPMLCFSFHTIGIGFYVTKFKVHSHSLPLSGTGPYLLHRKSRRSGAGAFTRIHYGLKPASGIFTRLDYFGLRHGIGQGNRPVG